VDAPCPSSLCPQLLLFAVVVLSPTFLLLGVSFLVVIPSPILLLIIVSPLLLDVFLVIIMSLPSSLLLDPHPLLPRVTSPPCHGYPAIAESLALMLGPPLHRQIHCHRRICGRCRGFNALHMLPIMVLPFVLSFVIFAMGCSSCCHVPYCSSLIGRPCCRLAIRIVSGQYMSLMGGMHGGRVKTNHNEDWGSFSCCTGQASHFLGAPWCLLCHVPPPSMKNLPLEKGGAHVGGSLWLGHCALQSSSLCHYLHLSLCHLCRVAVTVSSPPFIGFKVSMVEGVADGRKRASTNV